MEEKKGKYRKLIIFLVIIIGIEIAFLPAYFIFNINNNKCNNSGRNYFEQQEIDTFNSQWESYVGDNRTASEVYTVLSAAVANNASEENNGNNRFIKINYSEAKDLLKKFSLKSEEKYSVKAIYDEETGYITNLVFTEMPK